MSYNVLYREYRPQTLEDIVGQDHIIRILKNSISKNKLSHAYLFSGIRGTGKTTVARILAKYVNCQSPILTDPCNKCDNCIAIMEDRYIDVEEIDAASNRGIDDARGLRERVRLATQNKDGYRVIIIDEAHQLTPEASQALLKTFEEPPSNTIFILCTTEPNLILDTIHSRCQCLNFKPVMAHDIEKYLRHIIKKENWNIDDEIIYSLAALGDGSVRDAISQLEKIASCLDDNGSISQEDAYALLSVVSREQIYNYLFALLNGDVAEVFKIINNLVRNGSSLSMFVRDIMVLIKDIICVRACQGVDEVYNRTKREKKQILDFAKQLNSLSLLGQILSIIEEMYIKIESVKNLPPDTIIIEASMRIIARIISSRKKGD